MNRRTPTACSTATLSFVGPHRDLVTAEPQPLTTFEAGTQWPASEPDLAGVADHPAVSAVPGVFALSLNDFQRLSELVAEGRPNAALKTAAARRGAV